MLELFFFFFTPKEQAVSALPGAFLQDSRTEESQSKADRQCTYAGSTGSFFLRLLFAMLNESTEKSHNLLTLKITTLWVL